MTNTPKLPIPARLFASSYGFSLVELLVTLTVGSILTSLTVPAMTSMLNTQKAVSTANALFVALNLARSEAIKRNGRAVLCKTADGATCTLSGRWEQGWIVFHDVNNNALIDPDEEIILHQGAVSDGLRLTGNMPVANYVSYSASGGAKLTSGAFQAGTFTLCPVSPSSTDVRQIVLSGTGRARTQKGGIEDCL